MFALVTFDTTYLTVKHISLGVLLTSIAPPASAFISSELIYTHSQHQSYVQLAVTQTCSIGGGSQGQYMLGSQMLVAPVTSPADEHQISTQNIWLPPGTPPDWLDSALRGGCVIVVSIKHFWEIACMSRLLSEHVNARFRQLGGLCQRL